MATRIRRSAVREEQVVIADSEDVALDDRLSRDALTVERDTVGRAHVDHEILPVLELD
jgi:hypothetical protein